MSDDVVWMEQKRVMQNCFKLDSSPSQTEMNIISILIEWFKQISKGQAGKASKNGIREQNFIRYVHGTLSSRVHGLLRVLSQDTISTPLL